jgi:hypothetical protein
MAVVLSLVVFALVLVLVLWIRPSDVADNSPVSPTAHLEERRASIYENLRDLTFEFRLCKLSQADYDKTKLGLQEELASVMAAIDSASNGAAPPPQPAAVPVPVAKDPPEPLVCPHCKARFEKPMKFCGECGKAMSAVEEKA